MIVKAIYEPNFGDKTTGETYKEQRKIFSGEIFECDDELAKERIKRGLVVKATKEEIKEYKKVQETPVVVQNETPILEQNPEDEQQGGQETEPPIIENDNLEKPLEELSMEELIEIANQENIELSYPKDDTAQSVIIETIKKAREASKEKSENEE